MKRAAVVIAVLGISAWGFTRNAFAQNSDKAGSQNAPAGQAAPAGKRRPMAKTQEEYAAFNTANGVTDAAAQEKAANDFAAKFPDSELRPLLYKAVMGAYQQANNDAKIREMAQRVLTYDADDPDALLSMAQELADRTRDTDLDRDQRFAEAKKDAQRALITVDTDVPTAGIDPARLALYKANARNQAYYVLGTVDYNNKAWADAEGNLKKSIEAYPQQVDPITVFRLSVALDMQNKYPEALKYANQAVDLTKEGTGVGDAARKEKDRLTELNRSAPPAK
jgi:tetratricopeptide (TPR) repeat protein